MENNKSIENAFHLNNKKNYQKVPFYGFCIFMKNDKIWEHPFVFDTHFFQCMTHKNVFYDEKGIQ